jgi:hypothetical protein
MNSKQLARSLILLLFVGTLPACAINDLPQDQATRILPTIAPLAQVTPRTACTTTPDLEQWLQTSVLLRSTFQTRLDTLITTNTPPSADEIAYLIELRNTLNNLSVPDCALTVHTQLATTMEAAIQILTTITGITNIADQLTPTRDTLTQVETLHGELLAQLEEQFQATSSSGR